MEDVNEEIENEEPTETETEKTTETEDQNNPPAHSGQADATAGSDAPAVNLSADPLDTIGETLTMHKPEKQDHFVAEMQQQEKSENSLDEVEKTGGDWRQLKDAKGYYWHPEICSSKVDLKTSQPEKTKTDLWVLIRPHKRSELSKKPPKVKAQEQPTGTTGPDPQAAAEAEAMAKARRIAINSALALGIFSKGSQMIHGEEAVSDILGAVLFDQTVDGQHIKLTAFDLHKLTITDVLSKSDGGPEIHPYIGLAAVFIGSTLAMTFHKTKMDRRKSFSTWLKIQWLKLTGRKPAPAKAPEKPQEAEK